MLRPVLIAIALLAAPAAADAQQQRTRLWNLTSNTLADVRLAPTGSEAWSKNQCENDRDGTVDYNERLRITEIRSGRYDIRLRDVEGRRCIVRNVEVKEGAIFAIEEKDLKECEPSPSQ